MKTNNKRKEVIIIGALLLLMIVIIVGISYAAFQYGKTGTKLNSITTGSITMSYEETDNTISLSGALPTTDKTGTVRLTPGEYFDFTVSSEIVGDVNINYEISAKKEDGNTIDGRYIKLYLTRLTDDGSEEALMVPETYNEETSANDYTGRPSNEMSLYTSSMNSSESNRYRLRMYVDESYNPQGDGGGLTFSVRINVYGKAGDKYVPETTETILANNELQEETTNMFNYASNGSYIASITEEGPQYGSEPSQVTNGLYSMNDEDGVSYYYRGAITNNNVQFGEYESDYYVYQSRRSYYQSLESCTEANGGQSSGCTRVKLASAGDKMYWKIVRVNGDGSLRLIYNGTSVNPTNSDIANSYAVGASPYNLEYNEPKYTGYTYDRDTNETDSFIKREVDMWYENALGDTIYDNKVTGGRFCSDSSGYREETMLGNVFASFDRLGSAFGKLMGVEMQENVTPSLICPSTSESYGGSYRLKAGLITADELVLAGESLGVVGNSYLNPGESEIPYWTMTPTYFNGGSAYVWRVDDYLDYAYVNSNAININDNELRPVINVTTENGFTSGDGTASSPYVLS